MKLQASYTSVHKNVLDHYFLSTLMQIIEELLMQVMDSFILGFYFGKNLQNKHFSSFHLLRCALAVLDFAHSFIIFVLVNKFSTMINPKV